MQSKPTPNPGSRTRACTGWSSGTGQKRRLLFVLSFSLGSGSCHLLTPSPRCRTQLMLSLSPQKQWTCASLSLSLAWLLNPFSRNAITERKGCHESHSHTNLVTSVTFLTSTNRLVHRATDRHLYNKLAATLNTPVKSERVAPLDYLATPGNEIQQRPRKRRTKRTKP